MWSVKDSTIASISVICTDILKWAASKGKKISKQGQHPKKSGVHFKAFLNNNHRSFPTKADTKHGHDSINYILCMCLYLVSKLLSYVPRPELFDIAMVFTVGPQEDWN